jgi:hypothetical protein
MILDWMLNLASCLGRRRQPVVAGTVCSSGAGSAEPCGVNQHPFAAGPKAQITQQNIANWGMKTDLPKTVINTTFVYAGASP